MDLRPPANNLQLTGDVESLDTAAQTFRINSLLVNYSAASITGDLANGNELEVRGASLTADGTLLATKVTNAPSLGAAANEHVDISGIITGIKGLLSFTLGGQLVVLDLNTQLVLHGIPLGLNVVVDVQGTMTAQGAVLAKKVEIRAQGANLVRGLVDSLSAATHSLSVDGVNITTSAATEWADKSTLHLRSFQLTDIHVGDYVEVRGTTAQSGEMSAATLQRKNLSPNKSKSQRRP